MIKELLNSAFAGYHVRTIQPSASVIDNADIGVNSSECPAQPHPKIINCTTYKNAEIYYLPLLHKEECRKDILILLDTSKSIGERDFNNQVKPFLRDFVADKTLNVGQNGAQV